MNASAATAKPQPAGKAGQSTFSPMSASNILHDKLNGRRATPDSDAMASSEDEGDSRQHDNAPSAASHRPVRRASWLNDTNIGPLSQPGRKNSFASTSMSPTNSHPSTPAAETGTWASHAPVTSGIAAARGLTTSSSFPWGQGIWAADARKEPPSRLTEVLQSPPSQINNYGGSTYFGGDSSGGASDSTIQIPFPLVPTPKTYRSQSYSVGQLDADSNTPPSAIGAPAFSGRGRGLNSALQHRPSRPSMLSEMATEGLLGKLKEVEDDEDESLENSTSSLSHSHVQDQASIVEHLVRENAMLRQQQQQQQNLRLRPKSATFNSLGYGPGDPYGLRVTLSEESDFAVDENDEIGELQDISNKGMLTRRMSEYEYGANAHARGGPGSLENRKLETLKKAHWQTSLGFGGPSDLPQSRRHSFADVPTRHQSISSIGGEPLNGPSDLSSSQELQARFSDADFSVNDHASSYFGGASLQPRSADPYGMAPYQPAYNPYAIQPQYGTQAAAQHRSMYNVAQPRHNQMLYIVLFKCSRADVFYVQEGTGLSVKPGDLVIVEADRGTDLGTVAQDNVDWAQAKELKEQYAEEHYKWLMMYSQGAVGTQDGTGAGLMAASNGLQGSAVGGMGPPTQHGMQEPNPGELKPKIIKRLAQNHEIQALRDKEGNEAKAKRVCMQKVKEHGLHMEILDAEFQMDWKKLTFYYFADAYINFNSLVTDLFKVYKTRIWMSAINPASFASPSLGFQAPSGVGPGAVGSTKQHIDRRHQHQPDQSYDQRNSGYGGNQYQPADRNSASPTSFQQPFNAYAFSSFGAPPRTGSAGYGMPQIDPFVAFAPTDYAGMSNRFSSPQPHAQDPSDYARQGNPNDEWMNSAFQGLSLGSR